MLDFRKNDLGKRLSFFIKSRVSLWALYMHSKGMEGKHRLCRWWTYNRECGRTRRVPALSTAGAQRLVLIKPEPPLC